MWCHSCKHEFPESENYQCQNCNGYFIEKVESEDDPRNFVPYRQPRVVHRSQQIQNLISELLATHMNYGFSSFQTNQGRVELMSSIIRNHDNEDFNHILEMLMEQDPNRYGPPPAAKNLVQNLPKIKITTELLSTLGQPKIKVDECG